MFDKKEPGKFELAPELVAVQRQLANLTPTAPRVDRDQLMFNAGRAAERAAAASRVVPDPGFAKSRPTRFWPAATATMTAATILLSAMLLGQQRLLQPIAAETAVPQATALAESSNASVERINRPFWTPRATTGYVGVRNVVLARGASNYTTEYDAPTFTAPSSSEPATARQLFDELMPNMSRQRS